MAFDAKWAGLLFGDRFFDAANPCKIKLCEKDFKKFKIFSKKVLTKHRNSDILVKLTRERQHRTLKTIQNKRNANDSQ